MADSNVTPLHRGIVDQPRDYSEPARFVGPPRHVVIREPLLDRIGNALGSPAIIPIYLAFVAGALFTAGMALLWAKVLS